LAPKGIDSGEAMKKGEKGIALVAVLWTLTLLSLIATSFSSQTSTEARIARNITENAAARGG
jgi:Tfp pilus assembly protein PilX